MVPETFAFFTRLPLWLQTTWAVWVVVGVALFLISINVANKVPLAPQLSIRVKEVAPAAGGVLSGTIEGALDPAGYRVVVYARTNKWYVQPTTHNALTRINRDGSWYVSTRAGSEYAILLVDRGYQAPAIADSPPTGDEIISSLVVPAK